MTASQEIPTVSPLVHPLDEFYAHAGLPLPKVASIRGEKMPEPYKSLLVHEGDMTPMLEKFHKATLHLKVLRREQRGDFYYREVALLSDQDNKPVEFGAIKISLLLFPNIARREILEERLPLGSLLARHRIQHTSRPKAFLKIVSDPFINQALNIEGQQTLFGRRNTLFDTQGRPLAEIMEILPPDEG